MATILLSGCGPRVVITTGFYKDQLFTLGDTDCRLPEYMVYLTNIQNQYEKVYGDEIWNVSLDGVGLAENVKDTALERIARVKALYLMAGENGTVLTEEEEAMVKTMAEEYYSSLSEHEINLMGVSPELIEKMYSEYTLAKKVTAQLSGDINPEISDDEARIVTIQHIYFATSFKNGSGNIIWYSENHQKQIEDEANQVRELALTEGSSFEELAKQYSDDDVITLSFGKGEMDPVIEVTAFNMQKEEISEVIHTDNGYHIIKCINTLDREETDANKIAIIEKSREVSFGYEYDEFVSGLLRQLNDELMGSIELLYDEEVTTSSFFEIYDNMLQLS